jgi:hypothetical protein
MGLDMYLEARRYVGGWSHSKQQEKDLYAEVLKVIGMPPEHASAHSPSLTVQVNVAYWRKANQIHGWFVKECADGEDECNPAPASRQKLQELVGVCKSLLESRDKEKALKLLPPQEGFFFGTYEVDEWYWQDLRDTVEQVERALQLDEDKWDFIYQASW